jgi:hypothetical protein
MPLGVAPRAMGVPGPDTPPGRPRWRPGRAGSWAEVPWAGPAPPPGAGAITRARACRGLLAQEGLWAAL